MRKVKIKLDNHIKRLGMNQKEFAKLTGLRPATISQLVNNKYDRIQLSHLLAVMDALNTTDFNDLLTIEEE